MAKFITLLCFIVLLLLLNRPLAHAGRPAPALSQRDVASKTINQDFDVEQPEMVEESCEKVGEEECLIRRTLAAHIDYVYTQKHKP